MVSLDKNNSSMYLNAVTTFAEGRYASCIDDFLQLSSQGDARATLYAATIFDRGGHGVCQDLRRARGLYEKSLIQAYLPGAALGLAMLAYSGRGGPRDFSMAAKYFGMLRGNACAQIMLGIMYMHGMGRIKSEDRALYYFDRAWTLGHPLGLKNASIIRFRRKQYARAIFDFLRSGLLVFWYYGVRGLPIIRSPKDSRLVFF